VKYGIIPRPFGPQNLRWAGDRAGRGARETTKRVDDGKLHAFYRVVTRENSRRDVAERRRREGGTHFVGLYIIVTAYRPKYGTMSLA
jgi:hypothetical protein